MAQRCRLILIVLLLCGVAMMAAVQVRAWNRYRAAQTSLSRYHFAEARNHLAIPLRTWPNSWRVHLLAARAARLDGDSEEAQQHLSFCQKKYPNEAESLLEWALLRAQGGELATVEEYLHNELHRGSELTPLIQEALIEGYTRTYRIGLALSGVEDWLRRQPDDTQALFLQGCIWQQVQRPLMALQSYRRAVELDPQRDDARWRLSQCLVKLGFSEEANPHLEYLHRHHPENREMTVELARCLVAQGQSSEAQKLLDTVLADQPDCEIALRERGRLALNTDEIGAAEQWLRQALQLNPNDPQVLQLLSTVLAHQGKEDEAQIFQDRLKKTDADFARLSAICLHELGTRPYDPALYNELGNLLLRLGFQEAGRNWLLLAQQGDTNRNPDLLDNIHK